MVYDLSCVCARIRTWILKQWAISPIHFSLCSVFLWLCSPQAGVKFVMLLPQPLNVRITGLSYLAPATPELRSLRQEDLVSSRSQ